MAKSSKRKNNIRSEIYFDTKEHSLLKKGFLFKPGRQFYMRLQPVVYKYVPPDYMLLKKNMK